MVRVIFGLFFFAVVALAQPALTQTNHNPDTQKAEQPQGITPDTKPEGPAASTHEPEHSPEDRSKHEERCEYRGPAWFSGFYCFFALHDKFWVAFGTLVLAVGTGVLGFATVFLWRATRDLVSDAKTAGAEQLKISMKTAEAARDSADAVVSQLRAYLTFRPIGIESLGPGKVVKFKFNITNVGSTPAYSL